MGLDAVTRSIDTYLQIASEYVHLDVDPVVLRVVLSFLAVIVFGHALVERLFRAGAKGAEKHLSEGAKSGIYGMFFFSALIITPIFTYFDVLLGAVAAAILLLGLPYYYGVKIRERTARPKKKEENITHPAMAVATVPRAERVDGKKMKEEQRAAPKEGKKKILIPHIWSIASKLVQNLKKRPEKRARAKSEPKAKNIEQRPMAKRGQPEDQEEEKREGDTNKLPPLLGIFGRKKERKEEKREAKIRIEEITPESKVVVKEKKIRKGVSLPKIRTTKVQEVKTEKPVQKKEESEERERKPEPTPKPVEEAEEVPEDVITFRRTLDEIEKKYILKTWKKEPRRTGEARKAKTEGQIEYNKTVYNRIRDVLKNLLLEREKAKIERITWREVRELRKKIDEELLPAYHERIVEEAMKLGDRPDKTDVENAARRILGLPEKEKAIKEGSKKRHKRQHEREKAHPKKDEEVLPIESGEEDLAALLSSEESEEGGEEDLDLLIGGEEGEEEEDLTKLLET